MNYADRFRDSNRLLGRRGDVNSFRHSCAFLHAANKGRCAVGQCQILRRIATAIDP